MAEFIIFLITTIFSSFFILFFLIWFFVLGIVTIGMIFWIMMIVDVARREFKNENDKTTWFLIVLLTGAIGAIIYYIEIKRKEKSVLICLSVLHLSQICVKSVSVNFKNQFLLPRI